MAKPLTEPITLPMTEIIAKSVAQPMENPFTEILFNLFQFQRCSSLFFRKITPIYNYNASRHTKFVRVDIAVIFHTVLSHASTHDLLKGLSRN